MTDTSELSQEILDADLAADPAASAREPSPYEKKLRTEARQHRLRALEAERQRDLAVAEARQDADKKMATANERLVRAELKAHAVKAGIVDLDGLKLLDMTNVRLTDDGEVEGADTLIAQLRTSKPWLFGQSSGTSTSSSAKAPTEQDVKFKHAREMTVDEWKNARAEIIRRR